MITYIDIHSHILSGVDDGADTPEESMQMLRMAARDGISDIILTPHNKPAHHNISPAKISARAQRLQEDLQEEGIDIRLHAGNELYYRDGLVEEIESGVAGTMTGSRYVLVEFGPVDDYDYIRMGVYSLLMGGYRPILAHVERYQNVCVKLSRIDDFIEMGCYIQVNSGSIMGKYGFGTKQFARNLLKQRMLHFVATDAHDIGKRAPELSECAKYVQKKAGTEYMMELFHENPMRILRDEYI